MNIKIFLVVIFRTITIFYTLLALFYGIIGVSIDLTGTINFSNLADATAARQKQLAICIPYILIGAVLLTLLIIYYVSCNLRKNAYNLPLYGIVTTIVGAIFFVSFIIIAIHVSEFSMIMCIIPAFFLLSYGIYSIIVRKQSCLNKRE